MVRGAHIGTEEVEQAVAAIVQHLDSSRWLAVDLQGRGERPRHQHPPGCPRAFKVREDEHAGQGWQLEPFNT